MSVKEGYDVLRLIEHNQVCYVSSEYVKGKPLPGWIKYHPCIEKEELFRMICDIAGQLSQIHKCRGNPCYRYVNPYSIIVSEEGQAVFLDVNADSNNGQLRIMQRRIVREHFLPPTEPYYQKASVELDIYGFGRTLQYLLSEIELEPELCRSEEIKFQKIISRCLNRHSKKVFKNVSEIQRMIPRYKQTKKKMEKENRIAAKAVWIAAIASVAFAVAGGSIAVVESINSSENQQGQKEKQQAEEEKASDSIQEERLNMELGIVYFLKLKNYEKSKDYFKSVKDNALAENMAAIAEGIGGKSVQEEKFMQALLDAETELERRKEEEIGEKEDYYRCILRGYTVFDSRSCFQNILRLGKICLREGDNEGAPEILGCMAYAHEGLGELKEAESLYEEQLRHEEDEAVKEECYKKAAGLLVQLEERGRAQELLRTGIQEIENCAQLRVMYIAVQLGDSNVEREICIQNIKEQLSQMPELKGLEEFKKLTAQYGINMEGDRIWQEE